MTLRQCLRFSSGASWVKLSHVLFFVAEAGYTCSNDTAGLMKIGRERLSIDFWEVPWVLGLSWDREARGNEIFCNSPFRVGPASDIGHA